ncbi:MAG: TrkH family potassium uptake protein [Saprospiraceae bacterium]|nr:TrkH family potassium uptake protein [Saprospiraceae bacterium]MBK6564542.1 TrkH family potassium uptake protein [Saprospiraceae bacterium]MBK8079276.1 TrkH family potassium uptake protein [Saprospiraceae bacterium]MBK8547092.1 TrkH family potassium uptake protein [Saprospiraceae bacterium]MBK8819579.1 TrkH family potassium uptake protein [Saprospiraceae bacterium]
MQFNLQPISNVLGVLMIIFGLSILSCGGVALYYEGGDSDPIIKAGLVTFFFGTAAWGYKFKSEANVNKKEGYLIVSLAWILMSLFGALPYYFAGVCPNFANAFFESVSGLTTTGASIFGDIESLPKGILMWRSLSQWIGGMGIVVLTIALFPLLGIGGIELFTAESPGPTTDKLHPRIKETAKRLWFLYFIITVLLILLLWVGGMTLFDSINHAFATVSTGGFSTKNTSIAFYESPFIHYTLAVFMLISGMNFSILYYGYKRYFRKMWSNDEFRYYLYFCFGALAIISLLVNLVNPGDFEKNFRDSFFQFASIVTTTGFVTYDYTTWGNGLTMIFFLLLFIGGCAGSTAGGIKIIRHTVFVKNMFLEFRRILHPRAMIRLKINKEVVPPRILTHILVFLLVYLLVVVVGSLIMMFLGIDLATSLSMVATTLGNVGPGIGKVGPPYNFGDFPDTAKWVCSALMIIGRLELFTILILFSRSFWRTN